MKYDLLKKLSEENGGILQTSKAVEAGISKTYFLKFIRDNCYEMVSRGIYLAPDAWADSLYLLALRYPGMTYSHRVALYLHGMTDREPDIFTATVPLGYNASSQKQEGMRIFTVKREWYTIGISKASTNFGHTVKAYSPERTLCDILRAGADTPMQDRQSALKEYVTRKDRDIPLLMEYASIFHVDKTIRQYMEVLL